jgi:hypothetical protein
LFVVAILGAGKDKAIVGFAYLFRPTYPGFPVDISGVEQLHAAFFERKPHTRSWLVMRSRKSGDAGANVGHPYGAVATAIGLGGDLWWLVRG